jgi:hypothetical protein
MRSFFRSSSLIATLIGTLVIGIGGAATNEPGQSFVSTKSDRLALAGNLGGDYVTVETRVQGASLLCRLPIEIGMWNTPQAGRCN